MARRSLVRRSRRDKPATSVLLSAVPPRAMGGRLRSRVNLVSYNSALTSRLPFKMLYCIRHIDVASIDSSLFERLVHDFSRWPDERLAGDIFVVSRLFAHQHDWRAVGSLAKDGLGRALVKMTCRAFARSFADLDET